jgi:hypothetical protein
VTERRVLITNLWYVTIGALRMRCNALLLEPNTRGKFELRGFGTESAWPVFGLDVPSMHFEIDDARLVLPGAVIILERDDIHRPICVQTFEWDPETNKRGERFSEVWSALETSVARHWHAPYIPRLVHMTPQEALRNPSRAAGG